MVVHEHAENNYIIDMMPVQQDEIFEQLRYRIGEAVKLIIKNNSIVLPAGTV